jgi:hypothetical protein
VREHAEPAPGSGAGEPVEEGAVQPPLSPGAGCAGSPLPERASPPA